IETLLEHLAVLTGPVLLNERVRTYKTLVAGTSRTEPAAFRDRAYADQCNYVSAVTHWKIYEPNLSRCKDLRLVPDYVLRSATEPTSSCGQETHLRFLGRGVSRWTRTGLLARNNDRFACHPPDERSFVEARLTTHRSSVLVCAD